MEVGVLPCEGDDAYLEGVACGTAYGEAHAVDRYASFIHAEVTLAYCFLAALVFEGELMASLLVVDGDAGGCLIYMTLHDVAVQPAVEYHAALHVDQITHLELSQIGAVECLAHGCYGILAVLYLHHSEAHAVVCHALVYLQFLYKRAREGEVHVVLLCSDGLHTGHSFDDT